MAEQPLREFATDGRQTANNKKQEPVRSFSFPPAQKSFLGHTGSIDIVVHTVTGTVEYRKNALANGKARANGHCQNGCVLLILFPTFFSGVLAPGKLISGKGTKVFPFRTHCQLVGPD